jgi:hypothetical protein
MEISYHIEKFDGRFVKQNIYRQVGSPEVDAAWEALGVGCKSTRFQSSTDLYLPPMLQTDLFYFQSPEL